MSFLADDDAKTLIQEILTRMDNQADPALLDDYRRFIRKRVPLGKRSAVAAYLFMQLHQAAPVDDRPRKRRGPTAGEAPKARSGDSAKAVAADTPKARVADEGKANLAADAKKNLPEADSVRLFISAGRNRRAYPREIIALLTTAAGLTKDDIGEIRILDNFSFVQVRKSQADAIIAQVDGKPFRGRPLSIGFAKPKKDDAEDLPF